MNAGFCSALSHSLFVRQYFSSETPRSVSALPCIGSSSLHFHSNKGKARCEQSVTHFKCRFSLSTPGEAAASESHRLSPALGCSLKRQSCCDTWFQTENQRAAEFPVLGKLFQGCWLQWEAASPAQPGRSCSGQAAGKLRTLRRVSARVTWENEHLRITYF